MKRLLVLALSLCVVVTLLIAGCSELPSELTLQETSPQEPVTVDLLFPDGASPLNQEAALICTVKASAINIKNMSVEISLPGAFELVSGNLSWIGNIAEGDEAEVIRVIVRAVKTGNWTIELNRYLDPEENRGHGFQNPYYYYISISEDSAEWGTTPPWYKNGDHEVPIEVVEE